MSKLKKLEPIVKSILEEYEETRGDDFLLVAEVYYKLIPEVSKYSFFTVMQGHKLLNLPYFESIRRTRQKLQAENEHLRPSEGKRVARLKEEKEYIDYALNKKTR